MADIIFHSGKLIAIPKNVAVPTPRHIMTIQETSFDFKGDLKRLMGEGQYAVDAAIGSVEISLKCKNGQLNMRTVNELFFAKTVAASGEEFVENEQITVAAGAATLAGGAATLGDYGIFNKATGEQYTRVASAPAAKQYVFGASGALSFNVSENANVLLANYTKTNSTTMESIDLTNDLAGTTVTVEGLFHKKMRDGRQLNIRLYNLIVPSLSFAAKLNDYVMPEFTIEAFANTAGSVGKYSFGK